MRADLTPIAPVIYYISWVFIGNFILLNLFLAILLDSFLEVEEEEEENDKKEAREEEDRKLKEQKANESPKKLQKKKTMKSPVKSPSLKKSSTFVVHTSNATQPAQDELEEDLDDLDDDRIMDILREGGLAQDKKMSGSQKEERLFREVKCKVSFYLFNKRNRVRWFLFRVSKHNYFERVILGLIVVSSLKLAIDSYMMDLPSTSIEVKISEYIDLFFTISFTMEFITKSISVGFLLDQGAYLRDTWNMLDFFIVVSSLVDLALASVDLPVIKILRLLRTLRPLRFISHNVAMKTLVAALLESVGAIVGVVIVVLVVWLMFAILGVNFFAGKFFYCSINPYLYHTKELCLLNKGAWKRYDFNFDSVP